MEEITNLKNGIAVMKNDITYIKDSVKQNLEDHKEIIAKIDGLNNKYAPMVAWTVMVWVGRTIGALIITGVVLLIAQAYLYMG